MSIFVIKGFMFWTCSSQSYHINIWLVIICKDRVQSNQVCIKKVNKLVNTIKALVKLGQLTSLFIWRF